MKDAVNIISLTPSRWREYKTLRLHAIMQDPYAFGRTYEEDAMLPDNVWKQRLKEDSKTGYMLFAERSGILVGMAGALLDEGSINQHRARIISVYVLPEARSKGIGTLLLKTLLEKLTSNTQITIAYLTVNQRQEAAVKLYESMGFEIVATIEQAFAHNNEYEDAFYMSKKVHKLK